MSTRRSNRLVVRARRALPLAALLLGVAACGDVQEPILAPEPSSAHGPPGLRGNAAGWDLPLESSAVLRRAFPGRPCLEPRHREFDFWVGGWNVFAPGGPQIGTNVVTSELDGCLVQEHWVSAGGFPGRSLNTFDAETGAWHQDWASAFPQAITGRLRTSGGLVDDVMVLDGERSAAGGFTFLDDWTWTVDEQGNVIQSAVTRVPELGFESTFTGVYVSATPAPAPVTPTANCAAGAVGGATRSADFLVGEWSVAAANGPPLGSAEITSELGDCVFVERFESRGGLRAIAYTYYDVWVEAWFRIWVDSEGERLALRGGFDGPALVLEGVEGTKSGDVDVRVSWTPDGDDVLQVWEVSEDGGASWSETARLRYRGS